MGRFKGFFVICVSLLLPHTVLAEEAVASVGYVSDALSSKVDTGQVSQTLHGEYVITGAISVPTPPLPTAN